MRFSTLGFFHQNIRPGLLIKGLKPFRILSQIREDIQIFLNACGVIDTACMVHAVSLIPDARCMRYHWRRMHVCMWYHWYRMHGACGVIDTTCMVHALSLTPHAWCMHCHWHRMHNKFFVQLQKVKIICKTAMVCKKIKNACGVIDTACTIDERFGRPWQTLKGISIKNIYVPELSYPTTKKIYRFKGAT
jgi:hypothetical protein